MLLGVLQIAEARQAGMQPQISSATTPKDACRRISLTPLRTFEVMSPWDLGGDGKGYQQGSPTDEWYIKMMRK